MKSRKENNLGTTINNWKTDHYRLRTYLRDKYHVVEAYYFFGYIDEDQQNLYTKLQKAGFIVLFKEHNTALQSQKKGNVDTDIVFEIMKNIIDNSENFNKVLLVSGDGDYKKVVDYLVKKERFRKILFPNKKFKSSLYNELSNKYFAYLDDSAVQEKIAMKNDKKKRVP